MRPLAVGIAALLVTAAGASSAGAGTAPTRIIKGPYLTNLTEDGADVRFELDADGPATVELGRESAPASLKKFDDHGTGAMHAVHVTGLDPATRYVYLVRIGNVAIGKGYLTTAPLPATGAGLDFVVYGDTRTDPSAHAAIVRLIGGSHAAFLVNTGDVVADGGSAQDWQSFFDVEAPIMHDRPLFLAIGNHELYDDEAGAAFARYFGFPGVGGVGGAPKPYGTVRLSNARFFFLNGMDDWSSGAERQWLERELAQADAEQGLVWRIAVVHHGPWSSGPHGPNEKLVGAHIPELLAQHKVDLLLAGHDHIYERGDSGTLKYVVSGGGGAPLYRVAHATPFTRKTEPTYHFVELTTKGEAMHLLARRIDGSTLEECGFHKGGPWDCDTHAASAPGAPSANAASLSAGATPAATASRSGCGCDVPGGKGARASGLAAFAAGALGLALGLRAAFARRRRG